MNYLLILVVIMTIVVFLVPYNIKVSVLGDYMLINQSIIGLGDIVLVGHIHDRLLFVRYDSNGLDFHDVMHIVRYDDDRWYLV